MSTTNYAVKDREGTIHPEPSKKDALRSKKDFGGMIMRSRTTSGADVTWKPWKRRKVFLWVFLAIQAAFLIWLITGSTSSTAPTAAQLAQFCGNGAWQGVFTSYADCVKHGAVGLTEAGDLGKGLGLATIVIVWVVVDFLVGLTYGIYRLTRRSS
jgi:hypothetical protein